ncbi:unnamed protein product, partial [Medioppia subpectinata]
CAERCGVTKCTNAEKCSAGCFCKSGYGRNIQGVCVPKKDCSKAGFCAKNEEFDMCGNTCVELCDPPTECAAKCKPGCYCKKPDYFRDDDKKCVKDGLKSKTFKKGVYCPAIDPETTPKPKLQSECKAHEVFKPCGSLCGQSCSSLKKEFVCPRRKICIKGCFCVEGYYRNKKGKCVPEDECDSADSNKKPKKCKKYEIYKECGNHCADLCTPPAICPYECQSGCFCKDKYFRNKAGESLVDHDNGDPEKCKSPLKRSKCRKNCIQSCAEVTAKMMCPRRKACITGCFCKEGHVKDKDGSCVPEDECPAPSKDPKSPKSAKDDNEVPDCDDNEEYYPCGDYCIELCKPPESCKRKCKSGCFCKRYFYRNEKGVCVPAEKCPNRMKKSPSDGKVGPNACKKKNEEYSTCGRPKCHSCLELSKHLMCPNRQSCETGCFCRGGFYRTTDGDCVPLSKCIPKVPDFKQLATTTPRSKDADCKENEHYEDCGDHCIELCKPPDSCDAQCDKGCFCDKGYYRDKENGDCVPEKRCPDYEEEVTESLRVKIKIKLKCEDGEIYSECGTRCGQMCSDLFKSTICPKKGLSVRCSKKPSLKSNSP